MKRIVGIPLRIRLIMMAILGAPGLASAGSLDTWTLHDSGTYRDLYGSTYANGRFVVVGERGTILTSIDGRTWTNHPPVTSENLYAVVHGNGLFVASGGSDESTLQNALVTSPDGVFWTPRTVDAVGPIFSLAYGGSNFVAIGYTEYYTDVLSTVLVSSDGIHWVRRGTITNVYLPALTFGAGIFVAAGDDYAAGVADRTGLFTSADGLNWAQRFVPFGRMKAVIHGNGLFVVTGQDGTILTSSNGVAWTSRTSGVSNEIWSVAYGGGQFAAAVLNYNLGGSAPALLRRSTNGIHWEPASFGITLTVPTLAFGPGGFVAADRYGRVAQSGFLGAPLLTASRFRADTGFELILRGELGRSYQVQRSPDPRGSNWSTITAVTLVHPFTNILDATATNFLGRRFYRAVNP